MAVNPHQASMRPCGRAEGQERLGGTPRTLSGRLAMARDVEGQGDSSRTGEPSTAQTLGCNWDYRLCTGAGNWLELIPGKIPRTLDSNSRELEATAKDAEPL